MTAAMPEGGEAEPKPPLWQRIAADVTPLRESPEYRRWWAGYMVSNVGSQVTIVAAQLQVFRLTHSSFDVGITGLVTVIPLIVFGLLGGSIADAMDRRKLMLLTTSIDTVLAGLMWVQAAAGLDRVWVIYVLLGAQAGFFSIDSSARGAMLPRLVRRELLPAANSLGQISQNTALTGGPLLAGLLVGSLGFSWAYGVDALSFLAILYALLRLPPAPPVGEVSKAGLKSVAEGLRFLGPRKNLLMTFLVDINAMVFGMPRALFPALATGTFHGGAGTAGLLYAAPPVGALVGAGLSGWSGRVRRQGLAVLVSVGVWGAAIAGFGLSHLLWLGLVMLAIAGAADMVSAIFRSTILQVATPDSLRGRLQGVFIVVVAGGPRFGDVESGTVASLVSTEFSIVSGGLACIVGMLLLAARYPSFAKYDAADPVP
ncbi:MAG: MFS transporter [Frankiaceae bacterium]|nr:MFS transporter [Frankiaceae bacterium]